MSDQLLPSSVELGSWATPATSSSSIAILATCRHYRNNALWKQFFAIDPLRWCYFFFSVFQVCQKKMLVITFNSLSRQVAFFASISILQALKETKHIIEVWRRRGWVELHLYKKLTPCLDPIHSLPRLLNPWQQKKAFGSEQSTWLILTPACWVIDWRSQQNPGNSQETLPAKRCCQYSSTWEKPH